MAILRHVLLSVLLIFALPLWAAQPINLNTASAQELAATMKGIGETKAERIVEYREQHGDFNQVDDLMNVKGIGEMTIEHNRELLSVN